MDAANYLKSIKHGMFAKRDSFDEAMEYAYSIAKASGSEAHVMTAVQVLINTIVADLEKLMKDKNGNE